MSVAEQAGLSIAFLETLKTGFLTRRPILSYPVVSDDFHTPMSTPPSEAMDEDTGEQTMNISDLSQLDLSESQFYDKLYDRFVISHCPN